MNMNHPAPQPTAVTPGFEGRWHAIEFQPDLSVPQRFVIGVALSQKGKLTHYRVANEAARLKCFYGNRFSKDAWAWLHGELSAELSGAKGTLLTRYSSASPQMSIGTGHYASGSSADSALSRAFERVVTVVADGRKPRTQGIAQAELRDMLARILKLRMSTRYESIAQPAAGVQIAESGSVHTFDITYDDNKTASCVVSACYAGLDTARINVMEATTDLETFMRIRKREQIGLAVLTPSTDLLPAEAVRAWQDWWSNYSYKLRESDLVLLAESHTAQDLADQVIDWYKDNQPPAYQAT